MADYIHSRSRTAQARNDSAGYRTVALGGLLIVILAVAAWIWLRQPIKDAALPSSEPLAESVVPAPPIQPLATRLAPPPPSPEVAAAGDTRPAK